MATQEDAETGVAGETVVREEAGDVEAPPKSWTEWLIGTSRNPDSWAAQSMGKGLDAYDDLNGEDTANIKLEVSTAPTGLTIFVAEKNRKVRFLHNCTLIKSEEGEYSIVEISGLRTTSTLRVVPDSTVEGGVRRGRARSGRVPSKEQLTSDGSESEFKSLRGNSDAENIDEIGSRSGIFFAHPKLWEAVATSQTEASALAAAIKKVTPLKSVEVEGMTVLEPSDERNGVYRLLEWLWLVTNGHFVNDGTKEPNESETTDRLTRKVNGLLMEEKGLDRARTAGTAPAAVIAPAAPTTTGALSDATQATLREAMATMTSLNERILEKQLADQERKKMTHKLTDASALLFKWLAASDWMDEEKTVGEAREMAVKIPLPVGSRTDDFIDDQEDGLFAKLDNYKM